MTLLLRPDNVKRTAQVHIEDRVEIIGRHLLQRSPANDACVVHEDVQPAVVLERRFDDRPTARGRCHGLRACHRVTSGLRDLGDHVCGRRRVGAVAGQTPAGIVDDDLRPARREQQRIRAPQAAATAGDDGDAIVESEFRHLFSSVRARPGRPLHAMP